VLLCRWHQRLDDVDVLLPAVLQQLHLEAVVAEPLDVDGGTADAEVTTDPVGQLRVGSTGEHHDVVHGRPSEGGGGSVTHST
jgi:hypothetical protein